MSQLTRRKIWFYAAPGLALSMPTIPAFVYLPSFYAADLGLGLTLVGAMLLASRLLDVFTDPLIGHLSDRYETRFGARRPWIVVGGILAALGLVLLFSPPVGAGGLYLFFCSTLLYLGWTMVAIPYTAWGAELTTDYDDRARITGARESLMIAGILLASFVPPLAAIIGFSKETGLLFVALLAITIGLPTITLLVTKVAEGPRQKSTHSLFSRRSWRAIKSNKPFLRLLAAWVINGMANGIPAALFPLFIGHVLKLGEVDQGLLIGGYFLAGILAVPLWLWLAKRLGKHKAWVWAMGLACLSFVFAPMLGAGDFWAFMVICLLTGAAFGADMALPPAMQADVVDLDRLRSGDDRTGLFFAFWSMGTKLALALAVGLAFPVLAFFGFDSGSNQNEGDALLALAVIYALVPVVFKVIAMIIVWTHPMTKKRHDILQKWFGRHSGPKTISG